jgi:hypothetical protein
MFDIFNITAPIFPDRLGLCCIEPARGGARRPRHRPACRWRNGRGAVFPMFATTLLSFLTIATALAVIRWSGWI